MQVLESIGVSKDTPKKRASFTRHTKGGMGGYFVAQGNKPCFPWCGLLSSWVNIFLFLSVSLSLTSVGLCLAVGTGWGDPVWLTFSVSFYLVSFFTMSCSPIPTANLKVWCQFSVCMCVCLSLVAHTITITWMYTNGGILYHGSIITVVSDDCQV